MWTKIKDTAKYLSFLISPNQCFSCGKIGESICKECASKVTPSTYSTLIKNTELNINYLFHFKDKKYHSFALKLKHNRSHSDLDSISKLIQTNLTVNEFLIPIPGRHNISLGEDICKNLKIQDYRNLRFKSKGRPQKNMPDRISRLSNNSFEFECAKLKAENVTILDDVSTTGFTMYKAGEAVRKSNPNINIKYLTVFH